VRRERSTHISRDSGDGTLGGMISSFKNCIHFSHVSLVSLIEKQSAELWYIRWRCGQSLKANGEEIEDEDDEGLVFDR
jgi:hypothetical protein